jgi:hypothetical protein
MKSLLMVKMCNKANIFENQLGYFRNLWEVVSSLWGFSKICDADGGSVRAGNYLCPIYMYRNLYILYHLLSQWLFQCTCLCWISLINGVVLEFTTVLLPSIFICRFYGTTGSCGAGIYIAQKFLAPPFFMHENTWPPLIFHQPPLTCN